MSIIITTPIDEIEEEQEQSSRTYRLDLDNGRIAGIIDGLEAVEQAIRKALITQRFKCLIYDSQYGSEIEEAIIAGDATEDYIVTAIEGFVRDALKPDSRIVDVRDFDIQHADDTVHISFTADTIFGTTEIKEVI